MPKLTVDGVETGVPLGKTGLQPCIALRARPRGSPRGLRCDEGSAAGSLPFMARRRGARRNGTTCRGLAMATLAALCPGIAEGAPSQNVAPQTQKLTREEKLANERKMNIVEFRDVQALVGKCIVKDQYNDAKAYVLSDDITPKTHGRMMDRLTDGKCLILAKKRWIGSPSLDLPFDTFRYLLANALVQRDYPVVISPDLSAVQPLYRNAIAQLSSSAVVDRKLNRRERVEREIKVAELYVLEFGECVVRKNVRSSHELTLSLPESRDESAAIAALKPAFTACLTYGRTLTFDKSNLRGTVAVNYYRLVSAAGRATGVTGVPK